MTSVSILIPTHNRCAVLERTLSSLQSVRLPPDTTAELIVIANACTDDTESVALTAFKDLPFASRCVVESTPGLSVARNRAIVEAKGDIYAFLDDDVWVEPFWLEGLLDVFQNHSADIVAGKVLLWWEAVEKPKWWTDRLSSLLSTVDFGDEVVVLKQPSQFVGANFAFRAELAENIGNFDTTLGRIGSAMLAGEETDFLERAFHTGYQGRYAPRAEIRHWVPPERIEPRYLISAARGRGYSSILLKPAMSPVAWLRSCAGHTKLMFVDGLLAYVDKILRKPDGGLNHRVRFEVGRGGLTALLGRLRKP